ncbi:MAG: hypothetical protein ABIB79_05610 [archaeon]
MNLKNIALNIALTGLACGVLFWRAGEKKEGTKWVMDTITGIPKTPASNTSRSEADLSFVLNLPDGREVFCSYHGGGDYIAVVTDLEAQVIDANEDKQKISVSGKLEGNRMRLLEIDHPDFGKTNFNYRFPSTNSKHGILNLKHPDYKE